ncbi:MAG: NAD(P)-dependent oxidoreductase [Thermodesulfobacteriota bacterium]
MKSIKTFGRMEKGFDLAQAVGEADRCLLCHDAPCSRGCPSDTRPDEFIRKLRFRNITGAIRTIKENNILGGACGILCPTHRLCEKECSARFVSLSRPEGADHPIQIGKIQRFLIEHSWSIGFNPLKKGAPKDKQIAIVGSGPAGLSCAAELAKKGYQVTVFEARPEPGGVLRYGVASYRFDLNFLNHELNDIRNLGVEFKCSHPISHEAGAEELLSAGFSAVFLGPGLWEAERLNSGSRSGPDILSSIDYLSALRDGRFKEMVKNVEGKTIAVIGGGSVAMDCAESAVKLGAKDVYLIYRRSFTQMPAEEKERNAAQKTGVHFLLLNQPIEFITNSRRRLKGIKLLRTRLGNIDDSGRRSPKPIRGSEWILDCDMVIEAIGNKPETDSIRWYPGVAVDDRNLIKVKAGTCRTSVKGIFAGGDIIRGPGLVVEAVQDGKRAARAILTYLHHQEERR